jgi:hypothetical protein
MRGEEPPLAGDALQSVLTAILEGNAAADQQILDGA